MFCSPFDEALAHQGPPGVFLPDPEGALRFHPSWTRDAWGRAPGPHALEWSWQLFRDRGTGYVQVALVTSPSLVAEHPRMDVRVFPSREAAEAARAAYGSPPLASDPW
ncbi:MAG: hypothetical protein KC656_27930 [Myxococcales bacterium]|nr:hypothetical protein [Myxococcales bacterium]MCB9669533.1 hypothetical protein [Alphaproteobacteria bacterium]MCB9692084.1 hypothetical protein [Alphaproteobacteria bacterium]